MNGEAERVSGDVLQYILSRVGPLMGEGAEPALERPRYGSNSDVHLVRWPSGQGVVLRAFEDPAQYRRYCRSMRFANERRAPVPRLLRADGGMLRRLRHRRCYCVEEMIDGELAIHTGLDDAVMGRILQAVADLHDITSPRWGHLDHPRGGSYAEELARRAERLLNGMPADAEAIEPGEVERWRVRMQALAARIPQLKAWSLVHRHLAPDDIMMPGGDGRAVLLDNIGLRIGHWAQDLEDVLEFAAGEDESRRRELASEYFRRRRIIEPEPRYEEMALFFRAEYHLRKLRSALQKGGPARLELARGHLAVVRRLLA